MSKEDDGIIGSYWLESGWDIRANKEFLVGIYTLREKAETPQTEGQSKEGSVKSVLQR
jgi:hypothetical protein